MSISRAIPGYPRNAGRLQLHKPGEEPASLTRWLISGWPATVQIWSAEEWSRLDDRPLHAQQFANGTWCLLRIE